MTTRTCLISFIDATQNWPREFNTIKQFKFIEGETEVDFKYRVKNWISEDRKLDLCDIQNLKITCEGIWRRNDKE